MRVARKLILALVVVIAAVLAVQVYLRIEREDAMSEADMRSDHNVLARGLGAAVGQIWQTHGQKEALRLVDRLNHEEKHLHVRWVWLDAKPGQPGAPRVPASRLKAVAAGREAHVVDRDHGPSGYLYTYMPVNVPGAYGGALELAESLAFEHSYVLTSTERSIITAVILALLTAGAVLWLGIWFVGRPVQALIAKARRVGEGDLSGPLHLRQRDELSELAEEMNVMCVRLEEANHRIASETQARIQAIEQLRHADRLMTVGTLAAGIAHELGTPMNVIAVRSKMIAEGEAEGAEAKDNGRIIGEQTQRMTRIIRQLLDFARPSAPEKATTDLATVARQTLSLLEPIASRRRVDLSFVDGKEPLPTEVDGSQLQQALTNLVMNGIQAMPRGGTLEVRAHRTRATPPADVGTGDGEYVALTVTDEGTGISDKDLPHLFEPFFTTKDVGQGTGLGLSVSYGIVREHGGWIGVTTTAEKGSAFTIYLPEGTAA